MMDVRITEDAFIDLEEGYWFYEEREVGAGEYFASTLRAEIDELVVNAGIHSRVYRDYHRFLSRVFPYAIYYSIADHAVVV
jgi:plasmid stabilization system protein ParE